MGYLLKYKENRQTGGGRTLQRIWILTGIAWILCLILILPAFAEQSVPETPGSAGSSAAGSGGSLKLLDNSYPKDGFTHMGATNVGFKLYFDGNVTEKGVLESNLKCFKLYDSKDKEVPTKAITGDKRNNYILVTANPKNATKALKDNSNYKLTISGELTSADSRSLGEDIAIRFKTVDVAFNTKIYMAIMGLMLAGMVGATVLQTRRKTRLDAEVAAGAKGEKINPYKYAKEKGITVDEAMGRIEKERQKRAKRLGVTADELDKKIEEARKKPSKPGAYRVKGPRPISAAGSTYKTGRKAQAAAKKKEAAARRAKGTTNPRNKKGKGKPRR